MTQVVEKARKCILTTQFATDLQKHLGELNKDPFCLLCVAPTAKLKNKQPRTLCSAVIHLCL